MSIRFAVVFALLGIIQLLALQTSHAQNPAGQMPPTPVAAGSDPAAAWRAVGVPAAGAAPGTAGQSPAAGFGPAPAVSPQPPRRSQLRVTSGNGTLPNEQGQVWREYDISPYTARVTTTRRPEQSIIEWIMRETGYEVWHSEPLGILSANAHTLRVYHTPKMQAVVAGIVDRFVNSEAETHTFSMRVITLDNPNWRAKTQRAMHAIPAQTPGVNAWLLPKEDAAVIMADFEKRGDYRPHSSPYLLVPNGQSTVIVSRRPRQYIRDVAPKVNANDGYDTLTGQIDEGFSMEFSPLATVDGRTIDASLKCDIDQVERMLPVTLEVPTTMSPRQRARIEIPQIAQLRFHERFRWPMNQVLVVGVGMVPLPVPVDNTPSVGGLPLPLLPSSPARADLLIIIESKGPVAETPGAASTVRPLNAAMPVPRQ
jgi:hypothetical protein